MGRLNDEERKLLNTMLDTINQKKRRNTVRLRYADSKRTLEQVGTSIPPQLRGLEAALGWPEKTCSVMARRLRPRGFSSLDDSVLVEDVGRFFTGAQVVLAERMAIASAVRHGASFVFSSLGGIGEPDVVLVVRSALSATAIRDPRTRRITAALEEVEDGYNLWLDGETLHCRRHENDWTVERFPTPRGRVLCVPYVHNESVDRPFGRSRITRPVMSLTDMAVRVMLRQEVGAEFYISPARWLTGATEEMFVGPDGEPRTGWENVLGALLALPDVEDELGERHRVTVGQFTQMSMQPHSDHLRTVGMMFSGETAIPVGQLGILHDNPSSAEAMNASESEIVSLAEIETISMGASRVELALNVATLLEGRFTDSMAKTFARVSSLWMSPSTPTQAATADATMKKLVGLPWMADSDVILEDLGYDAPTILRLKADRARGRVNSLVGSIQERVQAAQDDPEIAGVSGRRAEDLSSPMEDAQALKAQFDALGVAIRAGVDPLDAAARLGLSGIKFTGAVPVSLRMPADESSGLEER